MIRNDDAIICDQEDEKRQNEMRRKVLSIGDGKWGE